MSEDQNQQNDSQQNGAGQPNGDTQQASGSPQAAEGVPKKKIPHPGEVHPSKHDAVMGLIGEQFAAGHYGVEAGSVTVEPLSPGRDQVSFVRTHNPHVEAEDHGLELGQ